MAKKYYLMSHNESDCLFIYNQEERDNQMSSDGFVDECYDSENIAEVIAEGHRLSKEADFTFNPAYRNNIPSIWLCTRMKEVKGMYGQIAAIHYNDPIKSDLFIRECEEQTHTNYNNCCEDWGKELTDDIISYVKGS